MCLHACCRGDLYGDMTQNLHDVRQSVAESILKLKEKLGLKEKDPTPPAAAAATTPGPGGGGGGAEPSGSEDMVSVLKSEGIKAIQDDNADLNKQVGGWVGSVT